MMLRGYCRWCRDRASVVDRVQQLGPLISNLFPRPERGTEVDDVWNDAFGDGRERKSAELARTYGE